MALKQILNDRPSFESYSNSRGFGIWDGAFSLMRICERVMSTREELGMSGSDSLD